LTSKVSPYPILAIVGPTGSGKSSLALALARRYGAEVVSCDALQVYRGLNLGTGKTPIEAREEIGHHLLDVTEPDREYSAADFMREAASAIDGIRDRGKVPLIVGGTGLYLAALLRGLVEGPGRSVELRRRLETIFRRRGPAHLHRLLGKLDARSAERLHPNDRVRVVRAIEITLVSGRPMSALMELRKSPLCGYRSLMVGLAPDREELGKRIEARIDRMIQQGWVDEVRILIGAYGREAPAFKAIGYREIIRYLDGEMDLDQCRGLIIAATRRYARRQLTWFRAEKGVRWFKGFGDQPELERSVSDYLAIELGSRPGVGEDRLHAQGTT
jgi:tRNA dimethylallyltransferase